MNGRTARLLRRAAAKAAADDRARFAAADVRGYRELKESFRSYTAAERTDARAEIAAFIAPPLRLNGTPP